MTARYLIMLILYVTTNLQCERLVDNTYYFSFENIYSWHCAFINGREYEDEEIRMVLYSDPDNIVKELIIITVIPLKEKIFREVVDEKCSDPEFDLYLEIDNPFFQNNTEVYTDKNGTICAFIENDQFVVRVGIIGDNSNIDSYTEFVKSYKYSNPFH